MAGAFQFFHYGQYLRPHRRGQQNRGCEHDCKQNQSWRTPRKKEISQAKNRLGENSVGRTCPPKPTENKSVLSAIWGKSGRQNGRQAEILSATQKIPKPLKGLGIRNAGDGGRTHTVSPPTDFESVSSANSNTPAQETILLYLLPAKKSSGQVEVGVFFCRTSCFLGPGRV